MLTIKNLNVRVEKQEIVRGLDLKIKAGEVHALMGPNGSGKSTLASVLMGHPKYEITKGSVEFLGKNLLKMPPHERAAAGLFLAFQYPKEIPGVSLVSFLRAAYNAVNKLRNKKFESVPLYQFKKILAEKMAQVGLSKNFMERSLNEDFSGGEKKKAEILQMAVLEPELAILDETDSGLDIDALKTICEAVHALRQPKQSILMITHYPRMLHYLKPDVIHIMMDGKIVMTGGSELADLLEEHGYDYVRDKIGLKKTSGLKILMTP